MTSTVYFTKNGTVVHRAPLAPLAGNATEEATTVLRPTIWLNQGVQVELLPADQFRYPSLDRALDRRTLDRTLDRTLSPSLDRVYSGSFTYHGGVLPCALRLRRRDTYGGDGGDGGDGGAASMHVELLFPTLNCCTLHFHDVRARPGSLMCTNALVLPSSSSSSADASAPSIGAQPHNRCRFNADALRKWSHDDKPHMLAIVDMFDGQRPTMYVALEALAGSQNNIRTKEQEQQQRPPTTVALRGYLSYEGCQGRLFTVCCECCEEGVAAGVTNDVCHSCEKPLGLQWEIISGNKTCSECNAMTDATGGSGANTSGANTSGVVWRVRGGVAQFEDQVVIQGTELLVRCGTPGFAAKVRAHVASRESKGEGQQQWQFTVSGLGEYRIGVELMPPEDLEAALNAANGANGAHGALPVPRAQLKKALAALLVEADLNVVSVKTLRRQLATQFKVDLETVKPEIKAMIMAAVNANEGDIYQQDLPLPHARGHLGMDGRSWGMDAFACLYASEDGKGRPTAWVNANLDGLQRKCTLPLCVLA